MKKINSLLLGTAAGIVAVTGAQAADLPVKARAVEYVKICSLYGAGYYYIPGSDTCIKFGGYVRADYGWNNTGARTPGYSGALGAQDRTANTYSTRHRANLTVDTRTQSAYGTLRTLTSLHFQNENGSESFNASRAMIQWAGFTFGRFQSYQDTWAISDSWHFSQQQNNSDTGANGVNSIAYTWELGNGMTLTLGADERRDKPLANLSSALAINAGKEAVDYHNGKRYPDPYIAFKVDQAWGYWATSFVAHDVSAQYYLCTQGAPATGAAADINCGRPADKLGWAIQTGAEFKLPMIAPGDRFGFTARYAQGASGFGAGSNVSTASLFGGGNNLAFGSITDGVFTGGTNTGSLFPSNSANSNIELTTTWTLGAGFEHFWTPELKSSFTGAYSKILYNSNAKAMWAGQVCGPPATAAQGGFAPFGGTLNGTNSLVPAGVGQPAFNNVAGNCNPDWGFFQGGIRTMWTPIAGFFLGVDVTYVQVWTAFKGQTANVNGVAVGATSGNATAINPIIGGRPIGVYTLTDQGTWSAVFRAQRNFNAGD